MWPLTDCKVCHSGLCSSSRSNNAEVCSAALGILKLQK